MSHRSAAAAAAVIIFIVISVIAVNSAVVVVTHSRSANKRRYNKIRVMYTRTGKEGSEN